MYFKMKSGFRVSKKKNKIKIILYLGGFFKFLIYIASGDFDTWLFEDEGKYILFLLVIIAWMRSLMMHRVFNLIGMIFFYLFLWTCVSIFHQFIFIFCSQVGHVQVGLVQRGSSDAIHTRLPVRAVFYY